MRCSICGNYEQPVEFTDPATGLKYTFPHCSQLGTSHIKGLDQLPELQRHATLALLRTIALHLMIKIEIDMVRDNDHLNKLNGLHAWVMAYTRLGTQEFHNPFKNIPLRDIMSLSPIFAPIEGELADAYEVSAGEVHRRISEILRAGLSEYMPEPGFHAELILRAKKIKEAVPAALAQRESTFLEVFQEVR